jgi:hypothetical protein
MKQLGLVPNFGIHVSESNLYIPTIDPPILYFAALRLWTDRGNIRINRPKILYMNVGFGNKAAKQFHFWEHWFKILVQCICNV